jgi:hypothetical protein
MRSKLESGEDHMVCIKSKPINTLLPHVSSLSGEETGPEYPSLYEVALNITIIGVV